MQADDRSPDTLAQILLDQTERARIQAARDPFGNPVLAIALAINRLMDEGDLGEPQIAALIATLRDQAFDSRARRLATYVNLAADAAATFTTLAGRLIRPDPEDSPVKLAKFRARYRAHAHFAAVFTAHPTFANPPAVFAALAQDAASFQTPGAVRRRTAQAAQRLQQEFDAAVTRHPAMAATRWTR